MKPKLKDSDIICKRRFYDLKIYIKQILHLHIRVDDFIGIQSWYDRMGVYYIELYFKNSNTINLEYSEENVWLKILLLFDTNI